MGASNSARRKRVSTEEGRSGLRHFFREMVHPSFRTLGLGHGAMVDYVTDLLARFACTDQLYRPRAASVQRLETIAGMLLELTRRWDSPTPYNFDRNIEIRRHCGDCALFMSGLFHCPCGVRLTAGLLPRPRRTLVQFCGRAHIDDG